MNERIKELAEQAGLVIEVGEDEDASEVFDEAVEYISNSYDIDLKKFAELIVRECGEYLMRPEFIGRSDLDWSMVLNEHFGVEE